MISLYDEAVIKKFTKWLCAEDQKLTILGINETERLFSKRNDNEKDMPMTLPLIGISRDPNISLIQSNSRPMTKDGIILEKTEDYAIMMRAIAIDLKYQIDIFTRTQKEADEYIRGLIFNIVNNPRLKVEIPYNGSNYEHTCEMFLDSTISNTSDIAERMFPDEFVRWSFNITIQHAYLFSIPIKTYAKVAEADLHIFDVTEDAKVAEDVEIISSNTAK